MNNNLETAEEMIDELDRLIELDSDLAGTEAMITDFRKQTESDQENPPKLENSQPIYENFYREIGRDFIDRYEDTIKAYEENGSESQEFYSKYERMISAYNRAVSSYNSFNQVVIYQ
jgi:DNA replication protein DnaD